MCGFLMQFGEDRAAALREIPKRLTPLLAHRGPDDFQTLSGSRYHLWSWRLALVDRLASQQPMRSSDGQVTVLFNGEIYNHRALRSQLKQSGGLFRTEGDTEVVLEAYRQWGVSCFRHFEGMFSVCVLDEREQKVFLARDSLGIKPIYFCQHRGVVWVASEPKAILAAAGFSPSLDREVFPSYLLFQTVPGTRTLFRSIRKVPPGQCLEFSLSATEPIAVHSTTPETAPAAPRTAEEAQDLVRQTLLSSAGLAFDSDLPLAFHLSGGLDSNLLISLFRHLHPDRETLGLCSLIEGEADPEWPHIQKFAALHGCRMERAVVDARLFFESLDEVTYYLDEPAGDPGVVPQFLVNKLCSNHGKIVLAGHGLDEMFFGYIRNLAANLLAERGAEAIDPRSERFRELPEESRAFFAGWEGYLSSMAQPEGTPATLRYLRKLCRLDPFVPSADGATQRFLQSLQRLALQTHEEIAGEAISIGDFMLAAETRIQLPALLQMEDRASMRYSVEARVPFCNPSVFAAAKVIPAPWKLSRHVPKGIIRDAFKDLLPAEVLSRKEKVGRPVPLRRWLGEPPGRQARERLEAKRELFRDLTGCDLLNQAQQQDSGPTDRLLWGLLSLARWIDLYKVSV